MILFEATSTETQKGKVEDLYAPLTLKSMSDYSSLPPFFPLRLSYEFFLFCKVKVSDCSGNPFCIALGWCVWAKRLERKARPLRFYMQR